MHPRSETQVQACPGPSLRGRPGLPRSCDDISPVPPATRPWTPPSPCCPASPPQAEKLWPGSYHRSALRGRGHCCREPLPGIWDQYLDQFQKLLVLRCLRGDKVTNAMQDFVAANLEPRFIEPQASAVSQRLG